MITANCQQVENILQGGLDQTALAIYARENSRGVTMLSNKTKCPARILNALVKRAASAMGRILLT